MSGQHVAHLYGPRGGREGNGGGGEEVVTDVCVTTARDT